jgi:ankyrin repeat protein
MPAQQSFMANLALQLGAKLNGPHARQGTGTALMKAAAAGDAALVKTLLGRGADAKKADVEGVTPLMLAVESQDLETVRALIPASNVKARSVHGRRALATAAQMPNAEIVSALLPLDNPSELDGASAANKTPFLLAIAQGVPENAERLAAYQALLAQKTISPGQASIGGEPLPTRLDDALDLMAASKPFAGDPQAREKLAAGVLASLDLGGQDAQGNSALHVAMHGFGDHEALPKILSLLAKLPGSGAQNAAELDAALDHASSWSSFSMDAVRALVDLGAKTRRAPGSVTPLMRAAGHKEAAEKLRGLLPLSDVSARGEGGTALSFAAKAGREESVAILLPLLESDTAALDHAAEAAAEAGHFAIAERLAERASPELRALLASAHAKNMPKTVAAHQAELASILPQGALPLWAEVANERLGGGHPEFARRVMPALVEKMQDLAQGPGGSSEIAAALLDVLCAAAREQHAQPGPGVDRWVVDAGSAFWLALKLQSQAEHPFSLLGTTDKQSILADFADRLDRESLPHSPFRSDAVSALTVSYLAVADLEKETLARQRAALQGAMARAAGKRQARAAIAAVDRPAETGPSAPAA